MKRVLKQLFSFLFVAAIISSCTEDVEYTVGEMEPVIIVDGFFTSELKQHQVKLTWSSGVYNTDVPEPVKGATVTIVSGKDIIPLNEKEEGYYYTDSIAGDIGKTYSLNITYDGESYNSDEMLLKDVADIDCAFMLDGDTTDLFTKGTYLVLMAAKEPAGLGDYYLWNLYVNDTLYTDTIGEKVYNSDELIDGIEFTKVPIFFFDTTRLDKYDNLKLEMLSISEDYYDFLIALQMERFRGSPFDGPAANVPTNMNNGALGFFVVSDVSIGEICKIVDPFNQLFDCNFACFGTMCQLGIIPCEDCQSLGIEC